MRMPVGSRLLQLLLLLCLITNVLAQAVDEDINDAQAPPPPAVPETPEHPENDIHLRPPPQPHPDIIDVAAPEQPEDPSAPPGELDPPPPGTDPVSSLEEVAPQPPSVDGQPPPSEGPPPTEDEATPPEVPEEPVSDGAPPSDEQPQPPRGPHNPWRVPSHGQPAVEIKAGHSFNFSWTPSTEGTVNLELWQIEESTPVPKFLLASDLENAGAWTWKVHANFPHGTGYCLVIVPPDRNLASLSPLFTVLGDVDYDMPTPQAPEHAFSLNDLDVSYEGTQLKLMIAVGIGFVICNLFGAIAWVANDSKRSQDDMQMQYSALEKSSGNRVFHSRVASRQMNDM